ncbi:MAG: hypothetical protein M1819_002000 [Sarea resinae]|nr:MAG: hypothetical protein M1819_002000 [Sarea resinae]
MATYGKKKKGLLSSFSVFHDDKESDHQSKKSGNISIRPLHLNLNGADGHCTAYSRLSPQRPGKDLRRGGPAYKDEDSNDELANSLPDDFPGNKASKGSNDRPQLTSRSGTSDIGKQVREQDSLSSVRSKTRQTNAPPVISPDDNRERSHRSDQSSKALSLPTKVKPSVAQKPSKSISIPRAGSTGEQNRSSAASKRHSPGFTSLTGGRKLGAKALNTSANSSNLDPSPNQSYPTTKAKGSSRDLLPSRSKGVFNKLKEAITERLGGSSERGSVRGASSSDGHRRNKGDCSSSSRVRPRVERKGPSAPRNQPLNDIDRINTKPVIDDVSLPEPRQQHYDPFSDDQETFESHLLAESFGSRLARTPSPSRAQNSSENTFASSNETSSTIQQAFSDTRSPLGQHKNVYEFSSSPVGSSTPRSHLEQELNEKRDRIPEPHQPIFPSSPTVGSSTPQLENPASDDHRYHQGIRTGKEYDSPKNPKRNSGDDPSFYPRPLKRIKQENHPSTEALEDTLSQSMHKLGSGILAAKDPNKELGKLRVPRGDTRPRPRAKKGLSIFESPSSGSSGRKKTAASTAPMDEKTYISLRTKRAVPTAAAIAAAKQSAIPKPVGRFGAKERRASKSFSMLLDLVGSEDDDDDDDDEVAVNGEGESMGSDELQHDDEIHKLGTL